MAYLQLLKIKAEDNARHIQYAIDEGYGKATVYWLKIVKRNIYNLKIQLTEVQNICPEELSVIIVEYLDDPHAVYGQILSHEARKIIHSK